MRPSRLIAPVGLAPTFLLLVLLAPVAVAEVVEITGKTTARVTQIQGGSQIQTDYAEQTLPGTATNLPLLSSAHIQTTNESSDVVTSAQCVSLLADPRVGNAVPPNDVGLDIGAYAVDGQTSYEVVGNAVETRRIRITPSEVALNAGETVRIRSLFALAGAFIVVADDADADLTGLEIEAIFSITQKRPNQEPQTRLAGRATWTGGPNATLTLTGSGVINPTMLGSVDLLSPFPDLGVSGVQIARLLPFPVLSFAYEYDVVVDEEFVLELVFGAHVMTVPRNVGVAAVFGLPQRAFNESLREVRGDDGLGEALSNAVATYVDTTGQTRPPVGFPFPWLSGLCGWFGVETALATACLCVAPLGLRRAAKRRRIAPPRSVTGRLFDEPRRR